MRVKGRLLALACLLLACSPNDTNAVNQYHAFLQSIFLTRCQAEIQCCAPPPFPDVPTCVAHGQQLVFQPPEVGDDTLRTDIVRFDNNAAQSCLTALQSAAGNCSNPFDWTVIDAYVCGAAFQGTIKVGSRCSLMMPNFTCVAGAYCAQDQSNTSDPYAGTCVLTPPVNLLAEGSPCTHDSDCASYNCTNTCIAPRTVGQFLCN